MTATPTVSRSPEDLANRLVGSIIETMDLAAVYIGDRLGLYASLATGGPATSTELATRTGTAERYVREWLEHQAVTGILDAENPEASCLQRRYRLPDEHQDVLVSPDAPVHAAPFVRIALGATFMLPAVVDSFQTGRGIRWEDYGTDVREGQAGANRPYFLGGLAEDLRAIPGVAEALSRPGTRVADVGCGAGWSSVGIARSFPGVLVHGFDPDAEALRLAAGNAAEYDVSSFTEFRAIDAAAAPPGGYQVVTAFECVHDLSDPVSVLASMRRMVAPGGHVIVVDERVAEQFNAPGDDVERMMYGWSLLCCLANGLADGPSAATGTVMRPRTLERYAKEAGFSGIEILPIENDFFRFYRLVQ